MTNAYPLVSVVFVTYERLVTLKPTLESFLANTDFPRDRLELILADDGSAAALQAEMRTLAFDRFCFAGRRGGLGANVNRGLQAATGDYILQLQDDWECLGPPGYLKRAVEILAAAPEIGMLILNQHPEDIPIRESRTIAGAKVTIYDNQPAIEVPAAGKSSYTDWPHLKRASFHRELGYYREAVPMWTCELDFARRVNRQTRVFVADQPGFNAFRHIGAEHSFNTGPFRQRLAARIAKWTVGARAVAFYRDLKKRLAP